MNAAMMPPHTPSSTPVSGMRLQERGEGAEWSIDINAVQMTQHHKPASPPTHVATETRAWCAPQMHYTRTLVAVMQGQGGLSIPHCLGRTPLETEDVQCKLESPNIFSTLSPT
mmetsp:Transcript_40583/g.72639  ORF Transcript_40583/g.72639 Transcript_40583/m.72639 type:complete len:113 (-) Transcript_40583:107-445(-)